MHFLGPIALFLGVISALPIETVTDAVSAPATVSAADTVAAPATIQGKEEVGNYGPPRSSYDGGSNSGHSNYNSYGGSPSRSNGYGNRYNNGSPSLAGGLGSIVGGATGDFLHGFESSAGRGYKMVRRGLGFNA